MEKKYYLFALVGEFLRNFNELCSGVLNVLADCCNGCWPIGFLDRSPIHVSPDNCGLARLRGCPSLIDTGRYGLLYPKDIAENFINLADRCD